jgi:hypothetical protein
MHLGAMPIAWGVTLESLENGGLHVRHALPIATTVLPTRPN